MIKTFWKVIGLDGQEIPLIFIKKKDATDWITEHGTDGFSIKKYGM